MNKMPGRFGDPTRALSEIVCSHSPDPVPISPLEARAQPASICGSAPRACSDSARQPAADGRAIRRAPPTNDAEILRTSGLSLLGSRDVVTVELWNSHNGVQIDRPGHEVF